MENHRFPESFPKSDEIEMYINGEKVDILKTNVAYFSAVSYNGKVAVDIKSRNKINDISISPLKLGIKVQINDCTASFELDANLDLYIEMQGVSLPLLFYGKTEFDNNVDNQDEATYYFKGGKIYEAGEIVLRDNESVFIEAGAIVKGAVSAKNASNIKIFGSGVLDGSYYLNKGDGKRTILLDQCTDTEIRDIIIIQPTSWMIMLAGCQRVHIDNVREIGEVVGSDGVDIVGSSDVTIENCIFKNNDDCIAIKAFECNSPAEEELCRWNRNVSDIVVKKCIFINDRAGNAMEIGHELQTEEIKNVKFHDIDVVCVHGYGAVFSIHIGDRAAVGNIVYENIRVQHYYDKLVDFRIMCSRFNRDKERGQLRDVLLKDIYVIVSPYNPGYSISAIGGYDENHTIENVTFQNFYLGGKKVLNADQLDLFTKNVKNIYFN